MDKQEEFHTQIKYSNHMILGIDVGGTSVKFGIVNPEGEISYHKKFDTVQWVKQQGFTSSLIKEIKVYMEDHPQIKGIGMGFPGLLSADRTQVLLLPNIPSVTDLPIVGILKAEFPQLMIRIENDAKCATLGEYHFGENKGSDNFMLITLGTGIGSGALINGQLFLGARGNGMEVGHILTSDGKTLEQHLGIHHLLEYAAGELAQTKVSCLKNTPLTGIGLYNAAKEDDVCALAIFDYVGNLLGEALTTIIRILDITTFLFGGGVSESFEFISPSLNKVVNRNLPAYYTKDLSFRKASLSNDAGLLGAAGLLMREHHVFNKVI
jgi:glucokinase